MSSVGKVFAYLECGARMIPGRVSVFAFLEYEPHLIPGRISVFAFLECGPRMIPGRVTLVSLPKILSIHDSRENKPPPLYALTFISSVTFVFLPI